MKDFLNKIIDIIVAAINQYAKLIAYSIIISAFFNLMNGTLKAINSALKFTIAKLEDKK